MVTPADHRDTEVHPVVEVEEEEEEEDTDEEESAQSSLQSECELRVRSVPLSNMATRISLVGELCRFLRAERHHL